MTCRDWLLFLLSPSSTAKARARRGQWQRGRSQMITTMMMLILLALSANYHHNYNRSIIVLCEAFSFTPQSHTSILSSKNHHQHTKLVSPIHSQKESNIDTTASPMISSNLNADKSSDNDEKPEIVVEEGIVEESSNGTEQKVVKVLEQEEEPPTTATMSSTPSEVDDEMDVESKLEPSEPTKLVTDEIEPEQTQPTVSSKLEPVEPVNLVTDEEPEQTQPSQANSSIDSPQQAPPTPIAPAESESESVNENKLKVEIPKTPVETVSVNTPTPTSAKSDIDTTIKTTVTTTPSLASTATTASYDETPETTIKSPNTTPKRKKTYLNFDEHIPHRSDNKNQQKRSSSSSASPSASPAAKWHQNRRKAMLSKYSDEILPLEQSSHGLLVALPILLLTNLSLTGISLLSKHMSVGQIIAAAIFPGSIFSLWQLQILHDALHGSILPKPKPKPKKKLNTYRDVLLLQTITKRQEEEEAAKQRELEGGVKSILSTTLQTLRDNPKSLYQNVMEPFLIQNRKAIHKRILFWGSMPSIFGYYNYLTYGHLTHHLNVGNPDVAGNLKTIFDSEKKTYEDGDILFVAHRMKLNDNDGDKEFIGPSFDVELPSFLKKKEESSGEDEKKKTKITMSISKMGFSQWKEGRLLRNALIFSTSFLYERFLLTINDVISAVTGKNYFFLNKPDEYHKENALYCRVAVLVRLALAYYAGRASWWKPLLFLYLSETLWSIPPHPACAMFVTNHGSKEQDKEAMKKEDWNNMVLGRGGSRAHLESVNGCIPSSSTYAGKWYSILTLGTNYHVEHHDFPTIALHKLGELRKIAPEFYGENQHDEDGVKNKKRDNIWKIMRNTFRHPEFYACMAATSSANARSRF